MVTYWFIDNLSSWPKFSRPNLISSQHLVAVLVLDKKLAHFDILRNIFELPLQSSFSSKGSDAALRRFKAKC